MKFFIPVNPKHINLLSIWSIVILISLAACAGDQDEVPTAVPQAQIPAGAAQPTNANGAAQGLTDPAVTESGQLTPLPRLEGSNAEASGFGGGAAAQGAPAVSDIVTDEGAQGIVFTDPFSETTFILEAALPAEPATATVLRTQQSNEVDLETARDLATQFGFTSELYRESFPDAETLEPGISEFVPPTIYYAFDGAQTFSFDPWSANYQNQAADYNFDSESDFAQTSQIAESFLRDRGLLDFPYAIQEGFGNDIFFVREIDGRASNQPEIVVGLSTENEVSYVSYQVLPALEDLGAYPLLSATSAWERLQSGVTANNIPYINYPMISDPGGEEVGASDFQTWSRIYQPGEAVQLYGWPNAFLPASGSGTARVQLFPYLLEADPETLNQIAAQVGRQIEVVGTAGQQDNIVQLNSWSIIEDVDPISTSGIIERQGEDVLFVTSDNQQRYLLPNVPAEVADGLEVNVFAWTSQNGGAEYPILQWENIDKIVEFSDELAFASTLSFDPAFAATDYTSITINEVELAYYFTYLYPEADLGDTLTAVDPPVILLQPAWKFTGSADNSEKIEFFVQAVSEDLVSD